MLTHPSSTSAIPLASKQQLNKKKCESIHLSKKKDLQMLKNLK